MIGQLTGIILSKQPPQVLISVNGVGYEVDAPMTTFYRLPEVGQQVTLHTHFIVREDAQLLYGFYEPLDRTLFRLLIKVNGVGPKLALTILSSMEASQFVQSITIGDSDTLVRLPGVGKKTAERLVIEMRDKLKDWQNNTDQQAQQAIVVPQQKTALAEANSALVALGFKSQIASRALSQLTVDEGVSSEELIRLALRDLA